MEDQDQLQSNNHSSDEEQDLAVVPMEVEVEAEPEVDSSSLSQYVCEYCPKKFGSGKALGGHKRVHTQSIKPKRDLRRKQKKSKIVKTKDPNRDANVDQDGGCVLEDGDEIHQCRVCPRSFPSDKALFGHLRTHPERTWRGSQPPPGWSGSSPNRPSPSSPVEPKPAAGDDNNLMGFPLSFIRTLWSKSRTHLAPASGSELGSESGSKVVDQATADALLMLGIPTDEGESSAARATHKIENQILDDIQSAEQIANLIHNRKKKKLVRSRKLVLEEPEEVHETVTTKQEEKIYICHPCNKSFNTHQAYGGHVSSHNKSRAGTKISADSTPEGSSSKPQVRDTDLSGQTGRRVLNIDLNELPPEEEEGEESRPHVSLLKSCIIRVP